jgi:hypothetical protein
MAANYYKEPGWDLQERRIDLYEENYLLLRTLTTLFQLWGLREINCPYFKVLFRHFHKETEDIHDIPGLEQTSRLYSPWKKSRLSFIISLVGS